MNELLRYYEVEKVMNFLQDYSPSLRSDVADSLTLHPLEVEAVGVLLADRVFAPSPRMLNTILRTRGHELSCIAEETGELTSIFGKRYQTTTQLARSAECTVYRAIQQQPFMKNVVVREYFANENTDQKTLISREMQKIAGLSHPSFASVLDGGESTAGHLTTVHELVEGTTLLNYTILANLDYKSCLELLIQVSRGIEYTEHLGLNGLNFVPTQFLVSDPGGQRLVMHTGFVPGGLTLRKLWNNRNSACTQKNMFCIPPECVDGQHWRPDSRANVFFTGGLLYLMMTGANPLRDYGGALDDPEIYSAHVRKYKPMSIANYQSSYGLRPSLEESMDEEALLFVSDSVRQWMRVHGDNRPSSTGHLTTCLVNEYHRVLCRQESISEANLTTRGRQAGHSSRKLKTKHKPGLRVSESEEAGGSKKEKFRIINWWAKHAVLLVVIVSAFLLFDNIRGDLNEAMDDYNIVTAVVYILATAFIHWSLSRGLFE
jgi:hypothetical protein